MAAPARSASPARSSIEAWVVALVVASTVLQCVALVAASDSLAAGTMGRHAFSTVEMALVVLLGVQGWRIVRWAEASAPERPQVVRVARLCLVSLALCAMGDLVNRNYLEQSFQWDDVVRHSYLITSVWFFLPGYAVAAWAVRRATEHQITARVAWATAAVGAVAGAVAFAATRVPGMGAYPSAMVAAYTVVLAVLGASTWWLVRTDGLAASLVVVLGCWLALVADLLIATWWIADDRYPTVEHANWILYFASLAMIQRLTFLVADRPAVAAEAGPVASLHG
jgi:hypothetical protein